MGAFFELCIFFGLTLLQIYEISILVTPTKLKISKIFIILLVIIIFLILEIKQQFWCLGSSTVRVLSIAHVFGYFPSKSDLPGAHTMMCSRCSYRDVMIKNKCKSLRTNTNKLINYLEDSV